MEMTIFVIEDDDALFDALKTGLESWLFKVTRPDRFDEVMRSFSEHRSYLIIMDVLLPKFDGFYWCRESRAVSEVPILFLLSRDLPIDMVMAMNMGADDDMKEPFHTDVLYIKVLAKGYYTEMWGFIEEEYFPIDAKW
ncbi:response regulator [Salipaludibacillus agaradhaerens]|nr:response regulator [Salipaludibacillus agaradhaerens]MCR6117003.1 response regulator [Salipaludibacillus agaradhaerens]